RGSSTATSRARTSASSGRSTSSCERRRPEHRLLARHDTSRRRGVWDAAAMLRVIVAILSVALIALMLAEFFITFLLPRRVKRDPRIARRYFTLVWGPWRAAASRMPKERADTMLGIFGPLGLLFVLAFLAGGVIVGFAGLHWADRSNLGAASPTNFLNDLYFSAGSFFTASTLAQPVD